MLSFKNKSFNNVQGISTKKTLKPRKGPIGPGPIWTLVGKWIEKPRHPAS
jgi:hypothetical protein